MNAFMLSRSELRMLGNAVTSPLRAACPEKLMPSATGCSSPACCRYSDTLPVFSEMAKRRVSAAADNGTGAADRGVDDRGIAGPGRGVAGGSGDDTEGAGVPHIWHLTAWVVSLKNVHAVQDQGTEADGEGVRAKADGERGGKGSRSAEILLLVALLLLDDFFAPEANLPFGEKKDRRSCESSGTAASWGVLFGKNPISERWQFNVDINRNLKRIQQHKPARLYAPSTAPRTCPRHCRPLPAQAQPPPGTVCLLE